MSQLDDKSVQSSIAGSYGPGISQHPRPRRHLRRAGIIAALIVILLIVLVLLFFPRPSATVTLRPVSKSLSNSVVVNVPVREVSTTEQGTQTGVPSGQPKPGTRASGMLTFKNYTPNAVTIPVGTLLTSITGQQIVTDRALLVPPDPIIPGVASVSAHAVQTGKNGNIHAMSIYKSCCFAGIFVQNTSAFSGGLDGQKAPWVQQSDIDSVANTLESSLSQKALAEIQSQLEPGEQLVNDSPKCSAKVTSNPAVGQSAQIFTVTVSLVCSDSTFNMQIALTQAGNVLKEKAAQELGPAFILVGKIATKIEQVTPGKIGTVDVMTSASGNWKYQFTTAIKSNIAKHIARATTADAQVWLLQQTGVADVSISIKGPIIDLSGDKTLPDDPRVITLIG